jgi:hypothetical protein
MQRNPSPEAISHEAEVPARRTVDYFSLELAKEKLNEAQGLLLPRLVQALTEQPPST